ncbi:hypothetical protein RJT34_12680 [Clitoria ternatea]|uniref:Uncharacterized protein n=1 Tax=Clitoria ternatea TaxID=43366 RepID=A0AAN9PL48_CLITE
MKKSTLMVSLVPDDVGKPIVKLEKTTCLWENPVFQLVKLVTIQNVEGYTVERNGEENGTGGLFSDGSLKHQLSYGSTDHESYNIDEVSPEVASWNDPYSFRQNSMQSKRTVKAIATENQAHKRSNTNWSTGSASDESLGDWTNSLKDNLPKERLQEPSDNATERLKTEISSLKR